MEINEKLDIFYRAAIAAADERSQTLLQEYKKTCGDGLLEYEKRGRNNGRRQNISWRKKSSARSTERYRRRFCG